MKERGSSVQQAQLKNRFMDGIRPQMESLSAFLAGRVHPDFVSHEMHVSGRQEFWHLHESGYQNRKLKVLSIGAHPDDTALSEGLEHVLVTDGKKGGRKETGLVVISVSPGQANGEGKKRIAEDVAGSGHLGADAYINLGFNDGNLPSEQKQITKRLAQYIEQLRPDIILLPDPMDASHDDHVAVSHASLDAIQEAGVRPIVGYVDHQFGDNVPSVGSVGFRLEPTEYQVFTEAFRLHRSQTEPMSDAVRAVLRRPIDRARAFYPGASFLGILRQDVRPEFSQMPISEHLGNRKVPLALDWSAADPVIIFAAKSEFGPVFERSHLLAPADHF